MKKCIYALLACVLLMNMSVYALSPTPEVSAQAAIVYHPKTGQVLYSKNANDKMLIASTTKIMTAVIALEQCNLEDEVEITPEVANVEGSSMYLKAGETYTVRELLYGLMLASGNDAATAIAKHVAGSDEAFAALMNAKAKELGLENTSFENPHGLDGQTHYSTAFDMARLMAYAMQRSDFSEIVSTRAKTIKGLTYVNHNKLLWQCEGVCGGKTGYTMAAGRTLVTCCERNGERLICVTLKDPNDWSDHAELYNWAYGACNNRVLIPKDRRFQVPVVSGEGAKVSAEPLRDVTCFTLHPENVECVIQLPPFAYGPIHIGDKAGKIVVRLNGKQIGEVPLVYMENYE